MKATVLVDNIPGGGLFAEWGLSIYIEYNNKNILLDFGATNLMFENARALNKSIEKVDFAVLSHCHFDHSGGMARFFEENANAPLYVRACLENCYSKKRFKKLRYNGVPKGVFAENKDRVVVKSGKTEISKGVYLLSHSQPMQRKGRQSHLYQMVNGRLVPDSLNHEQSLIFETEEGLVIFNSCCHSGADIVIREALEAFPNKKIKALVGGFHLFSKPAYKVKRIAKNIEKTGIGFVCTGHCTGERSYGILKKKLGEKCTHFYTGYLLEI